MDERNAAEMFDKDLEFKLNLLQNQLLQQATNGKTAPPNPFLGNLLPPMHLPFLSPQNLFSTQHASQLSEVEQQSSLPAVTLASAFGLPNVSTPSANAQSSPALQVTYSKFMLISS